MWGEREQLEHARKEITEEVFASGVWPLLSNLEDPDLGKIEASPRFGRNL